MKLSSIIKASFKVLEKLVHYLVEFPGSTIRFLRLNTEPALRAVVSVPKNVAQKLSQDLLETFVDWSGDKPETLWRELSTKLSILFMEVGDACLAWSVKQKENFSFVESFKLHYREEFGRLLVGVPCAMALLDWAVTKDVLRGVLVERILLVTGATILLYGLLLVLRLLLLVFLVTRRVLNLSGRSLLRGAEILGGHAVSIAKKVRKERQEKTDLFLKSKKLAQVCFLLSIWPIVPEVDFISLTLKVVHWALKGWVV